MFSNTVQEHIRYYVYRLIDPRDSSTFYVGKGHNFIEKRNNGDIILRKSEFVINKIK